MKLFFIVKNGTTVPNDPKFIVSNLEEKIKILNQLNIIGVDLDNYTFYDESSLSSQFITVYENTVLNHYFPPVKTKNNEYVYYPKSSIIQNEDSITYVCRWKQLDARNFSIKSMTYFCDDSEEEEYQRVLWMFINPQKEENGSE